MKNENWGLLEAKGYIFGGDYRPIWYLYLILSKGRNSRTVQQYAVFAIIIFTDKIDQDQRRSIPDTCAPMLCTLPRKIYYVQ